MNKKALSTLEYPAIIEMLQSRAASPMGKQLAQDLIPMTYISDIKRAQNETSAALEIILLKGSLPLGGIGDIRPALANAAIGGTLSAEVLLQVAESLYVCRKLINYGKKQGRQGNEQEEEPSCIAQYFEGITLIDSLENEINRCIKPSGEVADNASPKLADIRRSIRVAHDKIRDHLQGVIQSASYKNMLQDAIVTLRGDRFCVPVKAEYRGSFPGMVHDQSSTGATVFMEPLSVVELNNKIKNLHFEEKREEERILLKLSGLVAANGDIFAANIEQITYLDFIFAKGELSLAMKATEPTFNSRRFTHIRKGRHPLLNPDTVVPTEIYLGGEFSMLLITGPNTGGKTVSLKTLGLLTCMGQAGLHIPAEENSELAVFDDVFADIGDEQSIAQSLSTFSSHMKNIVGILDGLSHNALVLLDELGAGTDPTEGAALAIAILQYLRARQIRTVVTTHYSELKLYALSMEGVENASCEFDVETLRPTYRLLIGIPGKSNAFAIAKRLGLSDEIIDEARAVLSQKDIRFEDVITDLEASKKAVLLEQERAQIYRREAEKLREDVAKQEEKLRTQKEKLMQQARQEALNIVQQARKEADEQITKMQKQLQAASQKEIEEAKRQVREGLAGLADGIGPVSEKPSRKPPENLRRGDKVFIHSMNQTATVSAPPNSNGEVQLQAGILKIKVHISDLTLEEEETSQKFTPKAGSGGSKMKSLYISTELDLRGMLPEEAVSAADKYLDDAFLASLANVTLIHGKGTGAVRNAIHALLKRHPHVKEYRLGKYGEGEAGVTVTTLK
ncbi:MAG: endonuclease MutS2 [Firmicutes bacterium]|nr:endonuclease MutS2 [Bacillota bacterium]